MELNRAVAVAMAEGPERGLELIAELEGGLLERYHLLHATRADLLRRLDRRSRGRRRLPQGARADGEPGGAGLPGAAAARAES